MIKLGSQVKDNITGFEGIAIAHAVYVHGCARIEIQPSELKDGKVANSDWFDEQRVEVINETPPKVSRDSSALSGGPQNDPPRRTGP